jgi:F-type H+-transporting ATPase subunit delta
MSARDNNGKFAEYARAILDIGKATGDLDLLESEFKVLKDEIVSNLDLKKYLTDPSIAQPERIKTSMEILEEGATPAVKTALAMIITLDMTEHIEPLYDAFTELVNDFKKQAYVEVISAIELDADTLEKIKKDVDDASGLDVRIRNTVDGSIIGGLIIKIGEKVIDLSVKNKMDDIKARLKSVDLGGEEFGTED